MKAKLQNILGLAALGMTLLTTTVPTWAGTVNTPRVTIGGNQFSRWAEGSLVGVRYSADHSREQIGCRLYTLSTYSWTSCHAMDSAGRSLICGSGDWKFLETLRAMTDSSSIYFTIESTSDVGECKDIWIKNGYDKLK
jgi:hypothetical protein